jgi:hypothetical protein
VSPLLSLLQSAWPHVDSCPATAGPAGALARPRLVVVGSLVAGYLIAVWPPRPIVRPGPHLIFALWLAFFLLALLSGGELMRLREQQVERCGGLRRHLGQPYLHGWREYSWR